MVLAQVMETTCGDTGDLGPSGCVPCSERAAVGPTDGGPKRWSPNSRLGGGEGRVVGF